MPFEGGKNRISSVTVPGTLLQFSAGGEYVTRFAHATAISRSTGVRKSDFALSGRTAASTRTLILVAAPLGYFAASAAGNTGGGHRSASP
jgi:hypothetical protein